MSQNEIEGTARQDRPVDQDPILESLLLLMETRPRFEGTMTKLQEELVKVAKRAGLDVRAKDWPQGPARLSHRVRALSALLTKAGITVARERRLLQRQIILKRQAG